MKFQYPEAKREDTFDIYKSKEKGEVKINEPYRWLEDQNSEETKKWVNEENKVTRSFLDGDGKGVSEKILEELLKGQDYERFGWFRKRGSKLFFSRNPGTLNQDIIYLMDEKNGGFENAIEFLNPNTYSKDGTWSLKRFNISKSGRFVVFSYSKAGSDWEEIGVKTVPDIVSKDAEIKTLEDHIEWCKFTSITWDENETGFLYSRFPQPSLGENEEKGTETDSNINNKLYYHKIGTKQSEDILVYECPEHPEWILGSNFSTDFKTLFISISRDCNPEGNLYLIRNFKKVLNNEDKEFKVEKLIDDFNASYYYITNQGDKHFFLSNLNAPLNKIISIEIPSTLPKQKDLVIKDVIKERDYLMESADVTTLEKFYVSFVKDVKTIIQVFDFNGTYLKEIQLPGPGTAYLSTNHFHNHVFLTFTSLVSPSTTYYFNSENDDEIKLFKEPKIDGFVQSDYVCTQIFYESPKDKTKIPMFIAHRKDFVQDGNSPFYMTAYGGFNIPYSPSFSLRNIYFIDKFKGAFAIANIRGGGEYGKKWHEAGSLKNKQNCFDDFAGAAEYLFKNKYTNPNRLAVRGGSNGGLLMGACSNQYPNIFKCVIADVGVMDMLKFHKFTIGRHWTSDYGSSDVPEEFDVLIKYSPLHNIPSDTKEYPSILIATGSHDDRVTPLHSYKFAAELQHKLGKKVENPLLITVTQSAGHGAGKPLRTILFEQADVFNFISKCINYDLKF
ncbi:hypothetical protein DICPUDRAFT_53590 [Dictyostelium purpureum]|uniref:Prolyl endopeptidase n=1 Tax=Dictyostelium purpureum TaxID=5786 RepID=F0ZDJ7_DICPU|nr:uncharacterized protein DICPUDRAFT_53590 [Dictyostelium purpureum]EGC37993.1 hypothetical protein DICPUDRAFT_53590 [Dictyostelium purpureum]|eukprot:XP_003285477.1 hypothetical protein DICPUDRAFT_53590 [Dictyostelium purpureum]